MEFCIISPAAGLESFSTLSKRHLVLSHVENAIYKNFYKHRREEGDLIILDNGAYEDKFDEDLLLRAMSYYQPQVVVLPDKLLNEGIITYNLARRFLKNHQSLKNEWMYVPHAKAGDFRDFIKMMEQAIICLHPQWIGIPRVLATHIAPETPNVRAEVCRFIKGTFPEIRVHALGMAAGSVSELRALADAGCDSIDSSAPVWRGWNGYEIDDPAWKQVGTNCDFDVNPNSLDHSREALIVHNLDKCGVKFNGGI